MPSLRPGPEHLRRFYARASILRVMGNGHGIMFHIFFIFWSFSFALWLATEEIDRLLP
jgi:hypothetical protein